MCLVYFSSFWLSFYSFFYFFFLRCVEKLASQSGMGRRKEEVKRALSKSSIKFVAFRRIEIGFEMEAIVIRKKSVMVFVSFYEADRLIDVNDHEWTQRFSEVWIEKSFSHRFFSFKFFQWISLAFPRLRSSDLMIFPFWAKLNYPKNCFSAVLIHQRKRRENRVEERKKSFSPIAPNLQYQSFKLHRQMKL